MRKAQFVLGKPIMYTALLIIVGALVYFGYSAVSGIVSYRDEGETRNFFISLQNAIDNQAKVGLGSAHEQSFSLSTDIEQICFVDRTKGIDSLTSLELNNQLEIDDSSNIFFMPSELSVPVVIKNFELEYNPLCIMNHNGRISLQLTDTGENSLLSASSGDKVSDCTSVLYNGDDRIDIVFLGHGYSDTEEFRKEVSNYVENVFLATEPISSNRENFNFYMISSVSDFGCTADTYLKCDDYLINKYASNCPNDYVIVLADRSYILDLFSPVRSSAIGNVENINTADNEFVVIHEFGHVFAGLADEYIDEEYYADLPADDYPNCDNTECPKWDSLAGAGCYQGCSLNRYFRSVDNSIMRNYYESHIFGIVNEEAFNENFEYYGDK